MSTDAECQQRSGPVCQPKRRKKEHGNQMQAAQKANVDNVDDNEHGQLESDESNTEHVMEA